TGSRRRRKPGCKQLVLPRWPEFDKRRRHLRRRWRHRAFHQLLDCRQRDDEVRRSALCRSLVNAEPDRFDHIGNSALSGGGLFANVSTVTVTNTEILYSDASWRGGGAYVASGSLTLDKAWIAGNTAEMYGGGIVVAGSSLTMTNSMVFRN